MAKIIDFTTKAVLCELPTTMLSDYRARAYKTGTKPWLWIVAWTAESAQAKSDEVSEVLGSRNTWKTMKKSTKSKGA